MAIVYEIVLVGGAIVMIIWMLRGSAAGAKDEIIDPSDSYQIGLLIGMSGGTIQDAAAVRYALERFEKEHGRKATTREMAMVVGMMKSL